MPDDYESKIGFKSIAGIIATNSIKSNSISNNYFSCIYMNLRLVNHGCKPNIALGEYDILNNDDNERYIYAIRDITKGEELLISYSSQYDTHDSILNNLNLKYTVKCDCEKGSKPNKESDANRLELYDLKNELEELGLDDPQRGITISYRMIELLKKEEILEQLYYFGAYYNLLTFNLLKKSNNKKFVKKIIEKLLNYSIIMTQENSRMSREFKSMLLNVPNDYEELIQRSENIDVKDE